MIKSCYFWELHKHGNTLPEVVRAIKKLGVNRIEIKAADGPYAFKTPAWTAWRGAPNLTADLVAMLHQVDVHVYGWGFNHGIKPELEGDIAGQLVATLGLDGWIFDVEDTFIKYADAVARVERMFRAYRGLAPRANTGWSSFPVWKNRLGKGDLPLIKQVYETASRYVDFWEPQAYWSTRWNTTPAALCRASIEQHREILGLPVIPAGRAWTDGGWKMQPQDIEVFAQECRNNLAAGVSWWRSDLILADPLILAAVEREFSHA